MIAAKGLTGLEKKTHFKIPELARFLGISPQALHLRIRNGAIRKLGRTSSGGNYLIPREEAIRLLKQAGREVPGLWTPFRRRVLVIDGSASIRRLLRDAFHNAGLRLELATAPNAEDGLVMAATALPHVVVINDTFGGGRMQGHQAITVFRHASALSRTKIIGMGLDRVGMLKAGADHFLRKPFGLEELRRVIYSQAFARSRIRYSGAPLEGVVSDTSYSN